MEMRRSTKSLCMSIGRQDRAYWNCWRRLGFMSSMVSWDVTVAADVADVAVEVPCGFVLLRVEAAETGASARAFIPA